MSSVSAEFEDIDSAEAAGIKAKQEFIAEQPDVRDAFYTITPKQI
jgi:hypothetical protein